MEEKKIVGLIILCVLAYAAWVAYWMNKELNGDISLFAFGIAYLSPVVGLALWWIIS